MASQLNDAENLSRIREILFGSEIEGIENRVQLVKDEISQIIQQFEAESKIKNQELKQFIDDKVVALESLIEKNNAHQSSRSEGVEDELKLLKQHLDSSMDELNKQIDGVKMELHQLSNHNLELINSLQKEADTMRGELDMMKKSKIDKKGLADLFNRLTSQLLTADEDDK